MKIYGIQTSNILLKHNKVRNNKEYTRRQKHFQKRSGQKNFRTEITTKSYKRKTVFVLENCHRIKLTETYMNFSIFMIDILFVTLNMLFQQLAPYAF